MKVSNNTSHWTTQSGNAIQELQMHHQHTGPVKHPHWRQNGSHLIEGMEGRSTVPDEPGDAGCCVTRRLYQKEDDTTFKQILLDVGLGLTLGEKKKKEKKKKVNSMEVSKSVLQKTMRILPQI